MATQRQPTFISPEEYLEIQRIAEVRSEYISGEMYEMAKASKQHSDIVFNTAGGLQAMLQDKPCRGGVALAVTAPAAYLVPDLVVYCGEAELGGKNDVLLNPTVVIEVLSPTTADFDHGHKWSLYQQIPTLKHYVMIWQNRPCVEVYSRETSTDWHYSVIINIDSTLRLPHIDCELPLTAIYDRVEFDPLTPPLPPSH